MRDQLPNSDRLFSLLSKLRPVRGHPLVVIKESARLGERNRQAAHAFGCGPHDHHRVPLPRFASLAVPNATPEVNDFGAVHVHAAGGSELVSVYEVLGKRVRDTLKSRLSVTRDCEVLAFHT